MAPFAVKEEGMGSTGRFVPKNGQGAILARRSSESWAERRGLAAVMADLEGKG